MKATKRKASRRAKPVALPELRWAAYDLKGKRHVYSVPNPITGIVNKFNENFEKLGLHAEPDD